MTGSESAGTKSWYQRWWVWVLIVLGALVVISVIFAPSEDEEGEASGTSTTAAGETTTTEVDATTTTEAETTTTEPATTTTTLPPTTTTTLPPFEPVLIEGSGTDVVDIEKPPDAMIVTITGNSASSYFGVTSYDANNNRIELLVNTTEPYEGTSPLDWLVDEWTARFEIEGEGAWTILVEPLTAARTVVAPGTIEGDSDDVFLIVSGDLDTAVIVGNPNGRYFGVMSYGDGRELLVNTTDPFEGRVLVPTDTFAFEVEADESGGWSITFE